MFKSKEAVTNELYEKLENDFARPKVESYVEINVESETKKES